MHHIISLAGGELQKCDEAKSRKKWRNTKQIPAEVCDACHTHHTRRPPRAMSEGADTEATASQASAVADAGSSSANLPLRTWWQQERPSTRCRRQTTSPKPTKGASAQILSSLLIGSNSLEEQEKEGAIPSGPN